ncbi:MAG: hypothetical protein KDE51_07895, partial [Anaerolineales bacterium]|nr:hypothetical protein [Anaerolineales bacterium]
TVPPADEVEIRHYSFNNSSDQTRHLRLTSYGEVVLTAAATDERHPAFAKLFIESEYLPQYNALLFRRRPRSAEEAPRYLAHFLLAEPELPLTGRYESDRAAFLGRGGTVQQPAALASQEWLTGRVGATLDPIMALGQELTLPPRATQQIATVTLTADSRTAVLALIHQYWSWGQIGRAFKQAEMQTHKNIYAIKLQGSQLAHIHQLLSLLIFPHAALRAPAEQLAANQLGQSGLWSFGISGDYPILLLHIKEQNNIDLLSDLLKAHIYWRRRGLKIDLVLVNQQETNYGQEVQGSIHRLIHRLDSEHWLNRRGGIFVLRQDQMGQAQYTLLQTAARVVLHTEHGPLDKQLGALMQTTRTPLPSFVATRPPSKQTAEGLARPQDLQFDNGWGGFSADGREYVIYLRPGEHTPAPWINVIANDSFGCLVSANGGGYSWAINSGENRLTSWRNDPVSDQPAEALYIRDEETSAVWSPTPQPAPAQTPYLIRHGAGYTIFEHQSHQLKQQLRFFIAPDEPVKIAQLTLVNTAERPRRLTVTYYAEWVLGTNRYHNQAFIIPEYANDGYHALLAHNRYNEEFSEQVAFLSANKQPHGLTADRTEFIGRLGTLESPAALKRTGLQNEIRPGIDPCAVMQLHVDLPPGGSETVYFLLGQGDNRAQTEQLLKKYYQPEAVTAAWEATQQQWSSILNKITVQTPDKAMDLLLNQWLLYQALACRIWGRSALYQSSGAYGFRDQLQDVMSLMHTRPDLAREHLLRSARHQFAAGDVLHWWHPPSGRGVRTRITDDLVWLPYVTAHYVQSTGDYAVLDEKVPFLTGDPLKGHEEERYGHYQQTEAAFTLYEHCQRVLERATTSGRHGIPLMGAGDWNDGMNRVGIKGQGESIWLGWFIHATLTNFAQLCVQRGDDQQAAVYQEQAEAYRLALEENGWDGQWYRRAYFDDGTPLGSVQNEECQIDSIAQSWGVLSHAADAERAATAMQSVMDKLVKQEERLILLFNPPFDQTPHDPGYIKGYLPGIRENGGQYTHAALWTIWAMAELGDGDTAEALYRLINPIRRADTAAKADTYKVEPYVIAADVYGVAPHEGRGGWTWY